MTFSVIIVNWNVRDLLRECLRSVYAETRHPRSEWEIIVVDNASSDGSAEMVRNEFPEIVLIANAGNVGFGAANNQAYRGARGRTILLLNPDTLVRNGAIDKLVNRLEEQPRTGVLGCRVLNTDGTYQLHSVGAQPTLANLATHYLFLSRVLPAFMRPGSFYCDREPPGEGRVGWVSGACMSLRREALGDAIFDERFFLYAEDVDLCARVAQAGWNVVYTPVAEITHHDGRSFEHGTPENQLQKIRNVRKLFFSRHGRPARICFDVIVAAGFLMRAIVLAPAVALRSSALQARRTRTNMYLREALGVLRSPGMP